MEISKEDFDKLKEITQKQIWVMDAFNRGYKIEVKSLKSVGTTWSDLNVTKFFKFDWVHYDYRLKDETKWYPEENEICFFKINGDDNWYLDKFEAGDIYDKNSVIKSVGLNPNGSPYWDEIKQYKNTEFYND